MCGIVAAIAAKGKLSDPVKKWMWQALFTNSLRGFDSTGIFTPDTKGDIDIFKRAMSGQDFVHTKYANQLIDNAGWFMVGHNRAATRGKVTHENAHPFQNADITLVHNGTINNGYTLAGNKVVDVDSEAICIGLSKKDTPAEEFIGKIDGAYALVWHDTENDAIYISRNKERPLAYGITETGDCLLASESGMMHWLAWRNGIKLVKFDVIKEDTIFVIKQTAEGLSHQEIAVKKPQPKPTQSWTRSGEHTTSGKEEGGPIEYMKILKKHNISSTERVRFLRHELYGNGPLGCLWGHTEAPPYYAVQVNAVTYKEVQEYMTGVWLADIRNAFHGFASGGRKQELILVAPASTIEPAPAKVLRLVPPQSTTVATPEAQKSTPKGVRSVYSDAEGKPTSYKKWLRLLREAHGKCYHCGNGITKNDVKKDGGVQFVYMGDEVAAICPHCVEEITKPAVSQTTH